jgi:glycosyltransferase involved in cell wall biosynthesis
VHPKPLRLAFDATACLGLPTGIGAFASEVLRRAAAREDLAVSAFAISWRGRAQLAAACPRGVEVVRRPMAARPLRMAWGRTGQPPIEWWTGPVDVVHGPNFVVPPARRAARLVTVHDLTPLRFPELCNRDTLAYPALVARAVREGAWVHTPSQFVADEVVTHFDIEPGRVVAIPNGVTAERPGADADTGTNRAPRDLTVGRVLAAGHPYLLALGTIEPRKDLPALVEAFGHLAAQRQDLHLVVAGPDGWGLDAFHDALARSRYRDRIVRVGWIGDDDRGALLHGAAALAYPSRYEGFGLPPLEAMAAGVPVVATDAGALPEVLGGDALLVSAQALADDRSAGVRALADALRLLLDEPDDERRERVAAGRARAARYRWDVTADALAGLYHHLARR